MLTMTGELGGTYPWLEADAMFLVLVKRAGALEQSGSGADAEELDCVRNVMDAYWSRRLADRPGGR
jgi:hypothetical protein